MESPCWVMGEQGSVIGQEMLETKRRAKGDWKVSSSHEKAPNELKLFPAPLPIPLMLKMFKIEQIHSHQI
jgi:hypothetical protein